MARDWPEIRHLASDSYNYGHGPQWNGAPGAVSTFNQTLYALPYLTGPGGTIKAVGVRLTAGGAAGLVARVAIYDNQSSKDCYPTTLRVDAASLSMPSAATYTAAISCSLPRDSLVWLVSLVSSTATMRCAGVEATSPLYGGLLTGTKMQNNYGMLTVAYSFAAFPATFPASAAPNVTGVNPHIILTFSGYGA